MTQLFDATVVTLAVYLNPFVLSGQAGKFDHFFGFRWLKATVLVSVSVSPYSQAQAENIVLRFALSREDLNGMNADFSGTQRKVSIRLGIRNF